MSYPLPGTKFYELVKAQLNGKTHWQDSDDLEMMFQGTYTSDFYRTVRTLLHDQVNLQTHGPQQSAAEQQAASRSLERRWHELLCIEKDIVAGDLDAGDVMRKEVGDSNVEAAEETLQGNFQNVEFCDVQLNSVVGCRRHAAEQFHRQ